MLAGPVSISTRPTAQQGCFSVKPQDSDKLLLKVNIRPPSYHPLVANLSNLTISNNADNKLLDSISKRLYGTS